MSASVSRSAVVAFLAWLLAVGAPLGAQASTPAQAQDQSQGQSNSPQNQSNSGGGSQSTAPQQAQQPSEPQSPPTSPQNATPPQNTPPPQSQTPPGQSQPPASPQPQAQVQQATTPSYTVNVGPDYSKGHSWFPSFLSPYEPAHIAAPALTNSPDLAQLMQDGQLNLSLADAISLALENNLDISVQRYIPLIAETDILRTLSGGVARGVAGTGTATALGAIPLVNFDPIVSSTLSWARNETPINNPFLTGTGTTALTALVNNNAVGNFIYQQAFHTGTAFSVAFDNNRNSSNSPVNLFNPALNSTLNITFSQPLLNGFGLLPNTRFIVEAKNNKKVADLTFANQVITTISAVEDAYWELVFARESIKVQQAAVATSQKLYDDNKRQVEIGTLAPIEVTRAASQLATDQQNLIVAQTTQLQDQTVLMNAITKNPLAGNLVNLEIVPTDNIPVPPQTEVMPLQDAVQEAWQKRPELQQANINLKNFGIEVRATRNALLPTANLFAQYGTTGLGGVSTFSTSTPTGFTANTKSPIVNSSGQPVIINGQQVFAGTVSSSTVSSSIFPGGLTDAFDQLIHSQFPSYAFGLSLTIPIRNRSAQADSARAQLDERQAQTQLQQLKNTVVMDVRNAQIAVEQDRARVAAAAKASELAMQTLDADQKKYQLGATTTFQVIQDQRDLTAAQGTELRAKADLAEAEVAFNKAMGRTLDVNRITIADDKGGQVYHPPLIPGTQPGKLASDSYAGK